MKTCKKPRFQVIVRGNWSVNRKWSFILKKKKNFDICDNPVILFYWIKRFYINNLCYLFNYIEEFSATNLSQDKSVVVVTTQLLFRNNFSTIEFNWPFLSGKTRSVSFFLVSTVQNGDSTCGHFPKSKKVYKRFGYNSSCSKQIEETLKAITISSASLNPTKL